MLTNCPQVAANQVVNDKGVSIALFSGGRTNQQSLNHKGHAYYAEGFGVPWFHLFLYAGVLANTAEEAIEILTIGTPGYRKETSRETLLRGGGWIFMVSDNSTLAVVEVTADRFAVRRAGEFLGPEWTDEDSIVATNHNFCPFSYNDSNQRTDIPMTLFGDGNIRDSETGIVRGLTPSGRRFWALMWDLKHNKGQIDKYLAQHIMSGLHSNDPETGERIECAQDENGNWHPWGTIRGCNQGSVSRRAGSADGKVAVLSGGDTHITWTLGSPHHWQGAWDEFAFSSNEKSENSGGVL